MTTTNCAIDWAATGAMLGGIGAILSVLVAGVLVWLTWRYVKIDAELLKLNRTSLDALRDSVAASREMAEVMQKQLAFTVTTRQDDVRQAYEPFRHLIQRMIAAFSQFMIMDVRQALTDNRPLPSDLSPRDFFAKVEESREFDGRLHTWLSTLTGESSLRNEFAESLNKLSPLCRGQARDDAAAVIQESATKEVAERMVAHLQRIVAYIDERVRLSS